ncbi:MAG: hypothetical protein H7222_13245 [Methylotenera sp.]|nr:hypothetical protein [Oligoflexia bacterium]
MIPLRVHNVIDYVAAMALVLAPAVFGFADVFAARNVFLILGAALFGYSLFTDYYYSIAKTIPLKTHMGLDVANGVALMVSPWLFGYVNAIRGGDLAVHFIFGLAVIGLVTFTDKRQLGMSGAQTTSDENRIRKIA